VIMATVSGEQLVWCVLVFAYLSWTIALAGVAGLQQQCELWDPSKS
jgi:hypothetical protein